ncbi:MAG: metal ABC transporter permease, partial [Alphaproteobacteria bacterium]
MISPEMVMIVGPALAAGLMIGLTHAPLGIVVLRRGIIFIDLAIAQIAGLGVVAAGLFWGEPPWWAVQGSALSSAVAAALFFHLVERFLPERQEAFIGCSFVVAASLAVLLLTGQPHGDEAIEQLFSGQLLFVTWAQVALHAPVYGIILALWFLRPQTRQGVWFYLLFSAAITSSVQLTGVFVVFASLIAPALGAAGHSGARQELATAYGVTLIALLSGFGFAIQFDLPLGPLLVCSFMLSAILIALWRQLRHRSGNSAGLG